ncbi:hypothetical protein RO3G_14094 [Rhizopus delemar RA 99-880]|uniref:Uncharacterized protein n=1 Tax=Rhizopus delemar (strain RA 99-880 / ATCC MYA-4621 / FGSC 9543 / NRRL 43880) TaxID=246409 RepID=I1CLQ3_RHIO9|nr:hypothetical protein RO3G_14094 [Rhizopus delemar RA 99-880]|eukprot:EIE89383.1 hypothetical protein RO3G_14094 [Rhizopus delemar RA 99-880]
MKALFCSRHLDVKVENLFARNYLSPKRLSLQLIFTKAYLLFSYLLKLCRCGTEILMQQLMYEV